MNTIVLALITAAVSARPTPAHIRRPELYTSACEEGMLCQSPGFDPASAATPTEAGMKF